MEVLYTLHIINGLVLFILMVFPESRNTQTDEGNDPMDLRIFLSGVCFVVMIILFLLQWIIFGWPEPYEGPYDQTYF